ncbi:hypothetical protein NBRC110019_10220 [Neptunitalea chrysea]|uniref:DUF4258 domain-containing protein n=1 Tax=Neptunitalea chrysea TaxID=1647581 RepID=A0A9W6EVU4_9FLAO|nr:DUF4258 domain-containing protein [Neptunitalea chrysea]GLB51983.1 hypothetical protein NBRC110019_10220 [Neptunitalea chrysea]
MSSSLLKRLGFFLIGLSIGIVFVVFFLQTRPNKVDFCYLPNCRVLKNIRSKAFSVDSLPQTKMDAYKMDREALKNILTYGDVDFDASDIKSKPCKVYIVEAIWKEKDVKLTVQNCEEKATLKEISIKGN